MNTLRVARYGLMVGVEELAVFWNWKTWLGGWMIQIVSSAAAWVLLGKLLDSPDRLEFLLIGNAVVVGSQAAYWAVSASTWDRWDGTYPLLVASPMSLLPAIAGRTVVWLLNGLCTSLVAFVVLAALFGIAAPLPAALWLVPLIGLTCLSTFCSALLLGSVVTLAPQFRNILHRTATITLMTICGVSVPASFWPGAIQLLADVLPVTHGLRAIRGVLAGADPFTILLEAAFEVAVALGWLAVAAATIDRMAESGRASGSIELVTA